MPTPTHTAATHSAHGSGIAASSARPSAEHRERGGHGHPRAEPLGQPGTADAQHEAHGAVHGEQPAGAGQPERSGVVREERREHGERGHPDGEDDARADGVRVQPAPRPVGVASRSSRSTSRAASNATRRGTVVDTSGGGDGEQPGEGERAAEPGRAEHRLADDRTDAEPAVHGDGEVRRRLGPAVGRAEVGDQRHRGDEQRRLAGPGEPAQHEQERAASRRSRTAEPAPPASSGAADHHGAAAVADRRADRSAGGRRSPRRRTRRSPGRCRARRCAARPRCTWARAARARRRT